MCVEVILVYKKFNVAGNVRMQFISQVIGFFFSDVNECTPVYVESLNKTVIPAGCDQVCHNTPGNYTCSCDQGFQLLYDGKRCRGKCVV